MLGRLHDASSLWESGRAPGCCADSVVVAVGSEGFWLVGTALPRSAVGTDTAAWPRRPEFSLLPHSGAKISEQSPASTQYIFESLTTRTLAMQTRFELLALPIIALAVAVLGGGASGGDWSVRGRVIREPCPSQPTAFCFQDSAYYRAIPNRSVRHAGTGLDPVRQRRRLRRSLGRPRGSDSDEPWNRQTPIVTMHPTSDDACAGTESSLPLCLLT